MPPILLLFPVDAFRALRLGGQPVAPFSPARRQNLAATFGSHAGAEPVRALAAALAGLKSSLRHDSYTPDKVDSQKYVRLNHAGHKSRHAGRRTDYN
jgi:hypothetical protein